MMSAQDNKLLLKLISLFTALIAGDKDVDTFCRQFATLTDEIRACEKRAEDERSDLHQRLIELRWRRIANELDSDEYMRQTTLLGQELYGGCYDIGLYCKEAESLWDLYDDMMRYDPALALEHSGQYYINEEHFRDRVSQNLDKLQGIVRG